MANKKSIKASRRAVADPPACDGTPEEATVSEEYYPDDAPEAVCSDEMPTGVTADKEHYPELATEAPCCEVSAEEDTVAKEYYPEATPEADCCDAKTGEDMVAEALPSVEGSLEDPALVEKPLEEPLKGSSPEVEVESQKSIISPYTELPIKLLIGQYERVHYVPKHFLQPLRLTLTNIEERVRLPDIDINTGHILVHYLYTRRYQPLDTDSNTIASNPKMGFRQALLAHIMSGTYNLPDLQRLTMEEIKKHGKTLSISEVLDATKDDFARLEPGGEFHEYLRCKTKDAFDHNDRSVFSSDELLSTLDNPTLIKFVVEYILRLYEDRVSKELEEKREICKALGECKKSLHDSKHIQAEEPSKNEKMALGEEYVTVEDSETCTLSTEEYSTV
ncbi:hypothetical protein GQ44DRAFT_274170 [Phaeosphaeriaceae sp. PMI808]|nr:hypothetical protein GQ44DRAFT_274170 [Phaeosphaeriaceae sp. PMI808]